MRRPLDCPEVARIYTKTGDDGTTGLLFGGRVRKDAAVIEANGAIDEAQAFLGLARAEAGPDTEIDELLTAVERDLWVLMAELGTAAQNRHKLTPGTSLVTAEMLAELERRTDALGERVEMPSEFVIPGQSRLSALLDVARTVVRRAERMALPVAAEGSHVVPYLNRLSSLLWAMGRWQEGTPLLSHPGGSRG